MLELLLKQKVKALLKDNFYGKPLETNRESCNELIAQAEEFLIKIKLILDQTNPERIKQVRANLQNVIEY